MVNPKSGDLFESICFHSTCEPFFLALSDLQPDKLGLEF